MLKVLAIVAVLSAAAVPAAMSNPSKGTPAASHGCDKSYTYTAAKRGLRLSLRHHTPMSRAMGARAWRYVVCVRTRQHLRWLNGQRNRLRAWRRSYAHVWPIRFHALAAPWQQWAIATSSCEAHMNPATNTGNGFYGAFQFMLSTWAAAGGTGNPAQHSWHYQAVIAVRFAQSNGTGHWPNCP